MIEWMSTWAEQIIVAVIIGTIIEMILPNGKNKKYVKTIIGVYILFTIISPIISKVTKTDMNNLDFEFEKYLEDTDTYQTMAQTLSTNNDNKTMEIYINNIKEDMKNKIQDKGYKLINIDIKIISKDNEDYGKIESISLKIDKKDEEDKQENKISINEITIGNKNNVNNEIEEKNNIDMSKIKELKQYISSVYDVNIKNIQINNN
ncbi:MAG: stage III sporulation protein AF [Bacilli bacterium]|nr:stage III sporulation protein AF [Bacilli bacterium]